MYKRRNLGSYILLALQSVGGSTSKKNIKEIMASDRELDISSDDINFAKISKKSGASYKPFDFDFNFGIKELYVSGYIEEPRMNQDITLTEKGRLAKYSEYPSKEDQDLISQYWNKKKKIYNQKKNIKKNLKIVESNKTDIEEDEEDSENNTWTIELINQLQTFTPKKFESFSRLLVSKMGVKIDKSKGQIMSHDHGIDGFGYFESDEFRTTKVAIQAKRYSENNAVSEPEIDKFKGVMDGFNAEYGIFITTSYFTNNAKKKALKGSRSVTLIDASRIAELVERYEIYITPINTYQLNDYYFEEN